MDTSNLKDQAMNAAKAGMADMQNAAAAAKAAASDELDNLKQQGADKLAQAQAQAADIKAQAADKLADAKAQETASPRPPSTTGSPTGPVIWTWCPTRAGRPLSAVPCPTPWGSAGITPVFC